MEVLSIEDILSNITSDLVSFEENKLFVQRLFSKRGGQFLNLEFLCEGLVKIEKEFEDLKKRFAGEISVAWMYLPHHQHRHFNCVIIFFVEDLLWNNMALYYNSNDKEDT